MANHEQFPVVSPWGNKWKLLQVYDGIFQKKIEFLISQHFKAIVA